MEGPAAASSFESADEPERRATRCVAVADSGKKENIDR